MHHGLDNRFLYVAFKITSYFSDDIGNKECGVGTAFFLKIGDGLHLITNRHMTDYSRKGDAYKDYKLEMIEILGRFSGDMLVQGFINPDIHTIKHSNNGLFAVSRG